MNFLGKLIAILILLITITPSYRLPEPLVRDYESYIVVDKIKILILGTKMMRAAKSEENYTLFKVSNLIYQQYDIGDKINTNKKMVKQ